MPRLTPHWACDAPLLGGPGHVALDGLVGPQSFQLVELAREGLLVEPPVDESMTKATNPDAAPRQFELAETLPHPGLLMHALRDQVMEGQMIGHAAQGAAFLFRLRRHPYNAVEHTRATTRATMKFKASPSRAISRMLTRLVA